MTQDHRMGVRPRQGHWPGRRIGAAGRHHEAEGRSWMNAEECAAFLSMNRDESGNDSAGDAASLPPPEAARHGLPGDTVLCA